MNKNKKRNDTWDEIGDSLKTIVSAATDSLNDGLKSVSERLSQRTMENKPKIYVPKTIRRIKKDIRQKQEGALVLVVLCGIVALINGLRLSVPGMFAWIGLIVGLVLYRSRRKDKEQLDRFQLYCSVLEINEACKISELSVLTGSDDQQTIKDLKSMITKGMFVSPFLDVPHQMMYVTEEKYKQSMLPPTPKQTQSDHTPPKYPEEIQPFVQQIQAFFKQIRAYEKDIENAKITSQLEYMQIIVEKISDYIKKHPEDLDETNRMRKYYLPTTIKLLDNYQELMVDNMKVDSLEAAKKEIEDVLVTLNESYTQLYTDMCQDASIDIHSDISVLTALLKQDGLLDENDIMERSHLS